MKNLLILALGTSVWLLMVGVGLAALWDYSLSPGTPGSPPAEWPASSRIRLDPERFTVVVVAHPRCPCSRATIGELGVLMARANGRVTAYVLFVQLPSFDESWVKTDLWRSAVAIPGVTAIRDEGGIEAARFGAATSGQTMLYDRKGLLLFNGGITAARGHYGDNAGLTTVASLILSADEDGDGRDASVFGCPLFDHGAECSRGSSRCDG